MASKPNNKKSNQGKPVYKPRQKDAAQATATFAPKQSSNEGGGPAKPEQVDWQQVMTNASNQQQSKKAASKPVNFDQIHAGGNQAS